MGFDTFTAGVAPGGLGNQNEVKVLICYLLAQEKEGVSFEILHEALRANELVNYFSLVEALEQLTQTGHLQTDNQAEGSQQYHITPVGRAANNELARDLPKMVRQKAQMALEAARKRAKRMGEVQITEEPAENGYLLRLAIPDSGSHLLELTVFVPTREQSQAIQRRFLNDPAFLYRNILALLTGEEGLLEHTGPADNLFA